MTDWGGGYVTDVEYMQGFYRYQSPTHLAVACLMGGVACDVSDRFEALSYLEIGCGMGFGAMVLAASNPGWRVTAIDYNPAHIAGARAHAAAAGLTNITFLEADLASLPESPLAATIPEADVTSMHGVWSWVPEATRQGITRLLRDKVRAGGIVHLSYNALPAWQTAVGMQRLAHEAGRRLAGRSDRQATAGFEVVRALQAAEARHLAGIPFVKALIDRSSVAMPEYLAHEYMNDSWRPCFHADVVATLAEAKLEWVAAAELIENFPELCLNEAQRAVADRFDDPVMQELFKDCCLTRGLRQDVFVRGARRISGAARNAALGQVVLALTVTPESFQYEAEMPTGRAEFGRAFYGAVVAALAEGPKTVAELINLPQRASTVENPAELIAVLVGSDQATVVARPGAAQGEAARRFNATTARRMVRLDRMGYAMALASDRLGTGLRSPLIDFYILEQVIAAAPDLPDPDALVADIGAGLDAEDRVKLRDVMVTALDKRLPQWRSAGLL